MTTTNSITATSFRVEISTSIVIDRPAAEVWDAFIERSEYPTWNSFIRSWHGELVIGAKQSVRIEPTDTMGQTFRPRITELEPGRLLVWLGRVGIPGLLDGRHRFEVEAIDELRCLFVQSEVLSGALVPAFHRMLTIDTPIAFRRMNAELAARVAA